MAVKTLESPSRGELFNSVLIYNDWHLFNIRIFRRTQKRTQNAMTLMLLLTLSLLKSLQIQAG
jgi:hypothetical protein